MATAGTKRRGIACGKRIISGFLKSAAVHPIEQQRRDARFYAGHRALLSDRGFEEADATRALAEDDEYYNQLRKLYDSVYTSGAVNSPASEKDPKILTVPR